MTTKLPRLGFVILVPLLAVIAYGQDIRAKVATPPAVARTSDIIDPDSGIYGVPLGTTEDQFTASFGNPMGYVRLPDGMTGMIYGKTHCFVFVDGKLGGVRISWMLLDSKLTESVAPLTMFDGIKWRLPNGITRNITLPQVKQILGEHLDNSRQYRWSFTTERSKVDLDFMRATSQGEQDDALKVSGIFIRPR